MLTSLGRSESNASPPLGMALGFDPAILNPSSSQWKAVEVQTVRPAEGRWTEPVPARVQLDESKTAAVGVPLGGRVTQIMAEPGQEVRAGEPLFRVASQELAAREHEIRSAELAMETAHAEHHRTAAMVAAQAIPAKEELLTSQTLRSTKLAYNSACLRRASLHVSSHSAHEFVVRAPRSGRVIERRILPAQEVKSGISALMVIADLSSVWVTVDIFEENTAGLQPGNPARVTAASGTDGANRVIYGTIDLISPTVDPERHTMPIRLRVDNTTLALRPNSYVTVELFSQAPAGAVEIPASAVAADGAQQYVFVKGPTGILTRRLVVASGGRAEIARISSGLSLGEEVVVRGSILLESRSNTLH